MGVCDSIHHQCTSINESKYQEQINRYNFIKLYAIGKGGFGRVWKVQCKRTKNNYAMKEMSKVKIYLKKSLQSIVNERYFLTYLKHPQLINMVYAFQDKDNLFIVLDYLTGGDLRYHFSNKKKYNEEESKFIIACVVSALEYLEINKIIHRDIKPENLVFDSKGYLHLTDFGIAKKYNPAETFLDTSGTPGYMAPEVIMNKEHNLTSDYFALGVLAYELTFGKRPYRGKNRREIADQMYGKEIIITDSHIPCNWSSSVCDFINRLLFRKPQKRLGNLGVKEIKNHPWLSSIQWEELLKMELTPPFIPNNGDNFDAKYANKGEDDIVELYNSYLERVNKKRIINDFYFNIYEDGMNNNNQKTKSTTNQTNENIESTKNQLQKSQSISNKKVLKFARSEGQLTKSIIKRSSSTSEINNKKQSKA